MGVSPNTQRNDPLHQNAAFSQPADLGGVIGEDQHGLDLKLTEHLGGHLVAAQVIGKTERLVSFNRIESRILESVCSNLVNKTNTSPLLTKVEHDAILGFANMTQRRLQLFTTVTLEATHHVTREAFGVNSYWHALFTSDLPLHNRHVLLAVSALKGHDSEHTETRWEVRLRHQESLLNSNSTRRLNSHTHFILPRQPQRHEHRVCINNLMRVYNFTTLGCLATSYEVRG